MKVEVVINGKSHELKATGETKNYAVFSHKGDGIIATVYAPIDKANSKK